MSESKLPTKLGNLPTPSKLGRWAYTPRRRLAFAAVEAWAALAAWILALLINAGLYPSILLEFASLSTGAFFVNLALRNPKEERIQEAFEQDIRILEQLRLSPTSAEEEKRLRFRSYMAEVEKVRSATNGEGL